MSTTIAYDATSPNVHTMPAGQHMGYTTGSGVAWSTAQFTADPYAGRICQDSHATDEEADVLDVEAGAATVDEVVRWYKNTLANYKAAVRPGQRHPMIYCSRNSLAPIVSAFIAAGITGVPIWLADPGLTVAQAQAMIAASGGSFPIKGVQNAWHATYDADVFLSSWLVTQSGVAGSTVKAGNSGPAVIALQDRLNAWAAAKHTNPLVAVDGAFGVLTASAVKYFQSAEGLKMDGIAGPATWAALDANPDPPPAPMYGPPLHPKDAIKVLTVRVTVSWEPPAPVKGLPRDPADYTVHVYHNTAEAKNLVGKPVTVTGTTHYTIPALVPGQRYIVHIVASGRDGKNIKSGAFAAVEFTA